MEKYQEEYSAFVNAYKMTQVSGEEVGLMVVKMTNYFIEYNTNLAKVLQGYKKVLVDYQSSLDANGKPMSSAKAEAMADGSPEAAEYHRVRSHVQNLEQAINSLKALQRGVINEYSYSG